MPSSNLVLVASARVARDVRAGRDSTESRRAVTEAKLERAVREAVAAAPPLTAEQRQRLAALLTGGRS